MKINVIKYKKVKSTNDTALKLIKKNITNPTLVMTEKQTNGRGTVGKKWVSEKGNLFISLFFKFDQKRINFKQSIKLNINEALTFFYNVIQYTELRLSEI